MVTTWHPFTGNYTDEKASFIIEGYFGTIPKETENSSVRETEILIVIYNVINESNKSKIFGHHQVIYILINGNNSSIGDIVNQRPELLHSYFYEALKQMVLNEYINFQK
jgi:hypothetical protein